MYYMACQVLHCSVILQYFDPILVIPMIATLNHTHAITVSQTSPARVALRLPAFLTNQASKENGKETASAKPRERSRIHDCRQDTCKALEKTTGVNEAVQKEYLHFHFMYCPTSQGMTICRPCLQPLHHWHPMD